MLLLSSLYLIAQEIGGPYTSDANTVLLMHFDGNLSNNSTLSGDGVSHGNGISYIANTLPDLGQCLKIDNSNASNKSYISIPHTDELNLSQSWTIEAWFYLNSIGVNSAINPTIVSKATNGEANYFLWYHDSWGSMKGQFSNTDNKSTYVAIGNNTITTGKWFHTEYTRNNENNTHKIIIRNENKEIIAQNEYQYDATQATPVVSVEDLLIGSLSSLDNFYFDGYIDELRISNVVRDFSYSLDKPEITSENLLIYYDTENSINANTILSQLQSKIDFYKKYFNYNFLDHSKIFSINICKDLSEFNQFKPDDLPDFETSYIKNEILYIVNPTTQSQLGYFDSFDQAAMHAFAKMFVDIEYNNNASEWMKYGFARHQAGMKSTPEAIRNEISNLGRKPTMQEMNNWDQITSFDKYAFAYTIVQYITDVHTFSNAFYQIRFGNNSTSYGFRHINTESGFEEAWHYNLDLFYLRDTYRMEFQRETDHFYLYMVDEDLPGIDQWGNELEAFYTRFTDDMQISIKHKIHIFYYPELCDYHYIQGADDCPVGSVGEALGIDLGKFTRINSNDPMMNSMGLAQHELTHVIHLNLDFSSNPPWLLEGLATLMPDGLYTEEIISGTTGVIKEQVIVGFSEVAAAAGRYPAIDDFESREFIEQNGLDDGLMYYMLGSVLVDYLIKSSGYVELKNFILSDASDYTTLGFSDKADFNNSFYIFYNQSWKNSPAQATAINTQTEIIIDGNISETDWNLNQNVNGIYPFYQNWSNNTAKFGALWDDNYLYVAVEVIDNNLVNNDSDGWNDGVEVFVDADFNKAFGYDSYDRQFVKGWNNSAIVEKNNRTAGVLHSVKNFSGGYSVELAIPWSNLEISPVTGLSIGFDVSNVDNDGSKYQLIWSGNNYNNETTINFGELTLATLYSPVVDNIPSETINEGSSFANINLDDFVTDSDNIASQMLWSFSGNNELTVAINSNRIAAIGIPNEDWNGTETITFTATDPDGASGSQDVTFIVSAVNDDPVVSSIPNQTIDEGSSFTPINLDEFVADPDNNDSQISWSFSGENELSVEINEGRMVVVSIPGENWFGTETITFTATDPGNGNDSKEIIFTVNPVNDKPEISGAPESVEFVSDTIVTVDIWGLVSDIETPNDLLIYNFNIDSDSLMASFNEDSGILTLSAELEFGGEGKLIWSVSDSEESIEDTIQVVVEKAFIVGIENGMKIPEEYTLYQNYPNPFNPTTIIKYDLPEFSFVKITVFDIQGQLIITLVDGFSNAGSYKVEFVGNEITSGIYFYTIETRTFKQTNKMIMIR